MLEGASLPVVSGLAMVVALLLLDRALAAAHNRTESPSISLSQTCIAMEYSTADGDPTNSTAPLLLVHDCGNTSADIRLLVAGTYPQRNVTLEVRSMFRSLTVSAAGYKAAVGSVTIVLSACSWASMDGVGIQVLPGSYVMEELHVLMNCSWMEPQTSQQQMGWLTKQLMVVNQMPRSVFRFVVLEQARATKMCSMQQSFMSMSLITYVAMGTRPSDYPTLQILLEIRGLYRGACNISNPNSYPDGPFFFTLFGEVSDKPPSVSLTIGAAGSVTLIGRPGSHPSSLLHLRNNSVFSSSPLGVSVSLSSLRVELLPRGTINMKMSAAVLLVGYRNETIRADASIAWVANVEVIGWPSSLLYVGQSSSLIQSAYYTMRPIRLVNWTVFANGMNVSVAGGALFADVYEIESVRLTLTNGSVGVLSLPGSCIFAVCQGVLCEHTAYVSVTLTMESGSRLEIGAGCPGLASVPAAPSPHYGVGCWVRLRVTVNEHSALTISNGSSLLAASSVNGVSVVVLNGSNVIIRSQMSALVVGTRLLSVAVVCRMLSSLVVEDTSSVVVVNGTLPVTSATHSPSLSVTAPPASGNASSPVGTSVSYFVTLSDIHRATVTFELTDSSTLVMGNFTNVLLIQARGEALLPGYSSFSVHVEASTVALSTRSSPVYYSWLRIGMAVVFWRLDIDFRRSVLEYTAPVSGATVLSVGILWIMSLDITPNQTVIISSPSPISTITAVGTVITCHAHYYDMNASPSWNNVLLFRWMSSSQSVAGGAVVNNSNYSSVFSGCSRISVVQHTHTAAANETTSTQTFGIPRHALFRVAPPTVLTTTAFVGCSATDSVSTSRSPAGSRSTSSSQTLSDSPRAIPTAAELPWLPTTLSLSTFGTSDVVERGDRSLFLSSTHSLELRCLVSCVLQVVDTQASNLLCQTHLCPVVASSEGAALHVGYDELNAAPSLLLLLNSSTGSGLSSRTWKPSLVTLEGTTIAFIAVNDSFIDASVTVAVLLQRSLSGWPGVADRPYATQRLSLIVSMSCVYNETFVYRNEVLLVVDPRSPPVAAAVEVAMQSSQLVAGVGGAGAVALTVGRLMVSQAVLSCENVLKGRGPGAGVLSVSGGLLAVVDTIMGNALFLALVGAATVGSGLAVYRWHCAALPGCSFGAFMRTVLRLPHSLFPACAAMLPSTVTAIVALLRDSPVEGGVATGAYLLTAAAVIGLSGFIWLVAVATRQMVSGATLHRRAPSGGLPSVVQSAFVSQTEWLPSSSDASLFEGTTRLWFVPLDLCAAIAMAVASSLPIARSASVCLGANIVNATGCLVMLVAVAVWRPFSTTFGKVHAIVTSLLLLSSVVCGLAFVAVTQYADNKAQLSASASRLLVAIGYLSGGVVAMSFLKALVDIVSIVTGARERMAVFRSSFVSTGLGLGELPSLPSADVSCQSPQMGDDEFMVPGESTPDIDMFIAGWLVADDVKLQPCGESSLLPPLDRKEAATVALHDLLSAYTHAEGDVERGII